jgi:hypothetical protein
MKLTASVRRMLQMCPTAWRIFLRCLQLSCFLLICAALLLIAWNGDYIGSFRFYQLSASLQEMAQLALLGAVIVPPCVEDLAGRAR